MRPLTVEDMCIKLKPLVGDDADKLYSRYRLATTGKERAEVEQMISAMYQKYIGSLLEKRVLLSPPTADLNAEYPIGIIKYAQKDISIFGLRDKDWVRHLLICGMSGSGKTNLAFHIIGNFIVKKKPFLVFDWKKSFRPLLSMSPNIMCFTIGNEKVANFFRININRPPKDIPPKEWVNIVCDIITEAFYASYGVHKILTETMDETFRRFGIYSGSNNYPTWFDIKQILEEKADIVRGREAEWMASAMRIAHSLTFGSFGEAINDKKEMFRVEDLFDKQAIFELNSLNSPEKKFFSQFLLTYIYKLKKASDTASTSDFKFAIVVDEAHNIFLKQGTSFVAENITDMIYREVREYGISLVCLDQHISKLSDTVAGNSATIMAFQQILPDDVMTISKITLIEDRYYFSMLPVGYAIVKLAERHNDPFLIKVPLVELKDKAVTDYEIKNMMMGKLGFCDIKKDDDEVSELVTEIKEDIKAQHKDKQLKRVLNIRFKDLLDKGYDKDDVIKFFLERYDKELVDEVASKFTAGERTVEEMFLDYVKNHPGCKITDIYKAIGLSARKGNDMKNSFIEKGFIEIKNESTSKGMRKKVYITEKGIKYV